MVFLFDLGGVVLESGDPNTSAANSRAFEQAFGVTPNRFQDLTNVWREAWSEYKHGRISEDEFWRRYLTRAGARNIAAAGAAKLFRDLTKPMPGMAQLLTDFKGQGKTLALLTNTGREWLNSQRSQFQLDDYFSPIIASCDLGIAKPEPAIYERALAALGAAARDVVFVDDQERNLVPAQALGMRTILFENAAQLRGALVAITKNAKRKAQNNSPKRKRLF